jgi:hypothetical protein
VPLLFSAVSARDLTLHVIQQAGFASLWFRQTNVVWVGFTAVTAALDVLETRIRVASKQPQQAYFISESESASRLTTLAK